jgi:hypothetical protein
MNEWGQAGDHGSVAEDVLYLTMNGTMVAGPIGRAMHGGT